MRFPLLISRGAVTGVRIWLGALVVLIGLRVGMGTLSGLVAAGSWMTSATVATVLVLVVAALTRHYGPAEWAPVAGLLTALVVIGVGYGGPGTGPALPSLETPGRVIDLIGEGLRTIVEGQIPVVADRGLELVLVAAAALAAVVLDALALALRMAGLAGVALAALWAPTLVFERPPSTVSLMLGAAAWLVLLWLTRDTRGPDAGLRREVPLAAVITIGVALAAVLLGPLAAALPGYGTVRLPATWGEGIGGTSRLSLSDDLNLRASLNGQSGSLVLQYTSDVADVGPLRTATLMAFDGQRWEPGSAADDQQSLDGVLWPGPSTTELTGNLDVVLVKLDQPSLPIPLDPRAVSVSGTWRYDPIRDEVIGNATPGLTYHVSIGPRDLSADALRADHAETVAAGAPALQVPDTPFASRIADLAHQVVGDATTTYDQAMALQSYFRGSDFRYATDLPPAQTNDPLWDFLNSRQGYCVQYATAMVVMARDLGIPARIGIGFLPGERDANGTVSVTADRAHAWPELWFANAGWVRFEPTPAVRTGAPPAYADPAIATLPTSPAETIPTSTPGATPSVSPTTSGAGTAGSTGRTGSALPWLAAGAVLVAALAAAGATVSRRRRHPVWGPEEAWARLRRDAARVGVTWSDATTPRRAAEVLHAAMPDVPDGVGHQAVDQLASAVQAHRYAPDPHRASAAELAGWVARASEALSAARRDASPSAARNG
jgi:transglutaminase-like putative cysteine protease